MNNAIKIIIFINQYDIADKREKITYISNETYRTVLRNIKERLHVANLHIFIKRLIISIISDMDDDRTLTITRLQ